MYSVCSGSVSMLVKSWVLVQQYGIRNDRWPDLTYDFVSGLLEKKSPGLENEIRLKVLGDPLNYMERNPIMLSTIPEGCLNIEGRSNVNRVCARQITTCCATIIFVGETLRNVMLPVLFPDTNEIKENIT